jgi:PEP-CTERM motif
MEGRKDLTQNQHLVLRHDRANEDMKMTSMRTYSWMALATIVLFTVSPIPVSQAVMITVNTGSFVDVTPGAPVDLGIGSTESTDSASYVFENTANVTDLAVNLVGDGTVDVTNSATISGTFESVFFHFDPEGTEANDFSGSLTFDREIVAVIGARDGFLIPADAFFLPSGVTFAGSGRGQLNLESQGDIVTVSGNMLSIALSAGTGADDFRVLFRAVPEPGTVALLGISLLALGFLRRRKMPNGA